MKTTNKLLSWLTLIIFLVVCISCTGYKKLSNDRLINKYFNDEEIEFLNEFHDRFYDQICTNENNTYNECYREYANFTLPLWADTFDFLSPRLKHQENKLWFDKLDSNNFSLLWVESEYLYFMTPNDYSNKKLDTIYGPDFNLESRMMEVFSSMAEGKNLNVFTQHRNTGFPVTYKELFEARNISNPGIIVHQIGYPKRYNMRDPKVRLFIAITQLTIDDANWRKAIFPKE